MVLNDEEVSGFFVFYKSRFLLLLVCWHVRVYMNKWQTHKVRCQNSFVQRAVSTITEVEFLLDPEKCAWFMTHLCFEAEET